MAGKEGSVAPKERINVTFKPSTGEGMEELELPLKLMMIGDYTLVQDEQKLEDRKAININKNNFNEVLENHDLGLTLQVPNRLSDNATDDELAVNLQFNDIFPGERMRRLKIQQKTLIQYLFLGNRQQIGKIGIAGFDARRRKAGHLPNNLKSPIA